jgi:beta-glucosidase
MAERRFDDQFLFGAATAAFQIEGANRTDGRTDSIWDTFCRVDGAVINGDDGSVACDHYHRYRADVALMAALNLQSYRFSVSWTRVQPDAKRANPQGLDFYAELVDELLDRDIMPWLTLYHWDLPQTLQEAGGWANRDTAYRFAEYAHLVHDRLGDRVRVWTTLNEPWCSAFLGYVAGAHAPGIQDPRQGLAAAHHLMLGHGLVVRDLRAADENLRLGLTLNLTPVSPADPESPADREAARQLDGQTNRIFLDPIFAGAYPDDVLADVAGLGLEEVVRDGDLEIISTPIDVLGVNYYQDSVVSGTPRGPVAATEAPTSRATSSPFPAVHDVYPVEQDLPRTDMGWVISPDGLRRLLTRVHADYAGPAGTEVYVTENGVAFADEMASDGSVDDADRVAYLRAHLDAILRAIAEGVPVKGYFYWSLMDNFEWAWGYAKRFGIVRVDYQTQRRTVKASGWEYANIIAGRSLDHASAADAVLTSLGRG